MASPRARRGLTVAAMALAGAVVWLTMFILNNASDSLAQDIGTTPSDLTWATTAYALTLGAALVAGGKLSDIFGRRRVFVIGAIGYCVVSLLGALAQDDIWLILSRALLGIPTALVLPGTLSMISHAYPPEKRWFGLAVWAAATNFTEAVGPAIGGFVSQAGWRWIFVLQILLMAVALAITAVAVDESRDDTAERSVDLPGMLTVTVAVGALIFGFNEANDLGWVTAPIVGAFVACAVLIPIFLLIERRQREPMLDVKLFRRVFSATISINLVLNACFGGALTLAGPFFVEGLGLSDYTSNSLQLLPAVSFLIVPLVSGLVTSKVGVTATMAGGMVVMLGALVAMGQFTDQTPELLAAALLFVTYAGMGMAMTPTAVAAFNSVSRRKAGSAAGIFKTSAVLGGGIGAAFSASVFQAIERGDLTERLAALGVRLKESTIDALADSTATAEAVHEALATIPEDARLRAATVAHEAAAGAFGIAMNIWAGLLLLCVIATIVFVRNIRAPDEEEESTHSLAYLPPSPRP